MAIETKNGGGNKPEAYDTETGQFAKQPVDELERVSLQHYDPNSEETKYQRIRRTANDDVESLRSSSYYKKKNLLPHKYEELTDPRDKSEAIDVAISSPYFERVLSKEFSKAFSGFEGIYAPADKKAFLDKKGVDYFMILKDKNGEEDFFALDLKNSVHTMGDSEQYNKWSIPIKLMSYDLKKGEENDSYLLRPTNITEFYCFSAFNTKQGSGELYNQVKDDRDFDENNIVSSKAFLLKKEELLRNIEKLVGGKDQLDRNNPDSLLSRAIEEAKKRKYVLDENNEIVKERPLGSYFTNFVDENGQEIKGVGLFAKYIDDKKYFVELKMSENYIKENIKGASFFKHSSPKLLEVKEDNKLFYQLITKKNTINQKEIANFAEQYSGKKFLDAFEVNEVLQQILDEREKEKEKADAIKSIQNQGFSEY